KSQNDYIKDTSVLLIGVSVISFAIVALAADPLREFYKSNLKLQDGALEKLRESVKEVLNIESINAIKKTVIDNFGIHLPPELLNMVMEYRDKVVFPYKEKNEDDKNNEQFNSKPKENTVTKD